MINSYPWYLQFQFKLDVNTVNFDWFKSFYDVSDFFLSCHTNHNPKANWDAISHLIFSCRYNGQSANTNTRTLTDLTLPWKNNKTTRSTAKLWKILFKWRSKEFRIHPNSVDIKWNSIESFFQRFIIMHYLWSSVFLLPQKIFNIEPKCVCAVYCSFFFFRFLRGLSVSEIFSIDQLPMVKTENTVYAFIEFNVNMFKSPPQTDRHPFSFYFVPFLLVLPCSAINSTM